MRIWMYVSMYVCMNVVCSRMTRFPIREEIEQIAVWVSQPAIPIAVQTGVILTDGFAPVVVSTKHVTA